MNMNDIMLEQNDNKKWLAYEYDRYVSDDSDGDCVRIAAMIHQM